MNNSTRCCGDRLGLVAVFRDRDALDKLHREKRLPGLGNPGVQHLGDVGVVHHSERLPFLVETGKQARGIQAKADYFEGDAALHVLDLIGDPDLSHAAFAQLLAQFETAGEYAIGSHGRRLGICDRGRMLGAAFEDAACVPVGGQQVLEALSQGHVVPASLLQERLSLGRVLLFQGSRE